MESRRKFEFALELLGEVEKGLSSASKDCIELAGMPKVKRDKLLHYLERDPKEFVQMDVFTDVKEGDAVVAPDGEGDSLFGGITTELMTGNVGVRVLIVPGTPPSTVSRALKKIIAWIEREPELLGQEIEYPF